MCQMNLAKSNKTTKYKQKHKKVKWNEPVESSQAQVSWEKQKT